MKFVERIVRKNQPPKTKRSFDPRIKQNEGSVHAERVEWYYDFHQQNTLSDKTSTIKFKMHKVTQGDAISLSDKK